MTRCMIYMSVIIFICVTILSRVFGLNVMLIDICLIE